MVLILDEAQDMSDELLEEVRLLSNLETDDRKLLQIVLVGQPELRDRARRTTGCASSRQRITVRYHLGPDRPSRDRGLHPAPARGRGRQRSPDLQPVGAAGDPPRTPGACHG